MGQVMNGYSKRIWVLVLGIAVAMAIAVTLLFNQDVIALRQPQQGAPNVTPPSPSQMIKNTLKKIDVESFF
jgi:hypothetical protein